MKSNVYYLIAFDVYQIKDWKKAIDRCKEFSKWLKSLILFVRDFSKDVLTEQLRAKIGVILA